MNGKDEGVGQNGFKETFKVQKFCDLIEKEKMKKYQNTIYQK